MTDSIKIMSCSMGTLIGPSANRMLPNINELQYGRFLASWGLPLAYELQYPVN